MAKDGFDVFLEEWREFRKEYREDKELMLARLTAVETDVGGAKLLGKAAIGAAAVLGGVFTWALDVGQKFSHVIRS